MPSNVKIGVIAIVVVMAAVVVLHYLQQSQVPEYIETPSGDEYLPQDYVDPATAGGPEIDLSEGSAPSNCAQLEGFEKESCIHASAVIQGNPETCNSIESVYARDNCILEVAITTGNEEACPKIRFGKEDCFSKIALQENRPELCEKTTIEKDVCRNAVQQNDISICDSLGEGKRHCMNAFIKQCPDDAPLAQICYRSPPDMTQCDSIIDLRGSCYADIALEKNNPALCAEIGELSNVCYFTIAINTLDAGVCEFMSENRDNCVATIAFETGNPSLCEKAGTERQNCLADLS